MLYDSPWEAEFANPLPVFADGAAAAVPVGNGELTFTFGAKGVVTCVSRFDLFRTFDRKFGIISSCLYKIAKGVERERQTQALCPFARRRD